MRRELEGARSQIRGMEGKLNDPVFVAGIMLAAQNERENTNRILKNIYAEIGRLKALIGAQEAAAPAVAMLSQIDEQLVELARRKKRICAEDARKEFGYRGKNAASARLNRLYDAGILNKTHAGRKVYYFPRGE
jgi:hypothetical protein